MTILSSALMFFLVIDPFGNIPFFLAALDRVEPARRRRVLVRELLLALGVLIAFLFAGRYVLAAMQISEPSLTIAGGIILFMISVRMVFPVRGAREADMEGEPFVFPLAIPYIAGPSALASVLFITNRDPSHWPRWLLALVAAWAAAALIIVAGSQLGRFLGARGLLAVERLMGMVLTTISVQMFMTGIRLFLA